LVVPESLLSNKSYQHVAEYLTRNADLQAVIGMPESLFKTSGKGGTHTKTCLIVAKKLGEQKRSASTVFMAEAKWCGQDSRARTIPHNDLPKISRNLAAYQAGKKFDPSNLGFVLQKVDLRESVLCPRYYDPQAEQEIESLSDTHDLLKVSDLLDCGILSISTGDEIGKLAYGTGTIPFIRTSDISNWEIKSDPKHGVSRDIYERLRTKQDVRPGDILMVKDGTYLIGTCAIVTKADVEMLYQSHLYKIRVNNNDKSLNPYLLLAILSSTAVQKQIRSKQFTQDIIDSLGKRIQELILPVPKNPKAIAEITELVRRSVEHRIEARQLAQKARQAIAS
jgi:type I restriction enzyme M protein